MKKFPLFLFIISILFMPLFFTNARVIDGLDGDNVNTGDSIDDGKCGSAINDTFSTIPSITNPNLCLAGDPSFVYSSSPSNSFEKYMWYCFGINNGSNAFCSAYKSIDGKCGSANDGKFFSEPTENLCKIGDPSSVSLSSNKPKKYLWECSGIKNGENTPCSAYYKLPKDIVTVGLCGDYDGSPYTTTEPTNLCKKGVVQNFSGPSISLYTWDCRGSYSEPVSCSVKSQTQVPFDGKCGTANGVSSKEKPAENLCSVGNLISSIDVKPPIKKDNEWIWICRGTGLLGKNSPDCKAPVITEDNITKYQCNNGIDDDEDGLIDTADPECHTDGNVSNSNSYVATNDSESTIIDNGTDSNNEAGNKIDASSAAGGLMPKCPADGCGFKEVIGLINNVIKFLIKDIAIPLAAIVFMYAGFLLITASGDPGKLTKAKAMIKNVLIGFVIALAAWLIINTILSSLGVTNSLLGIGK